MARSLCESIHLLDHQDLCITNQIFFARLRNTKDIPTSIKRHSKDLTCSTRSQIPDAVILLTAPAIILPSVPHLAPLGMDLRPWNMSLASADWLFRFA
jgi:hypothetical protein